MMNLSFPVIFLLFICNFTDETEINRVTKGPTVYKVPDDEFGRHEKNNLMCLLQDCTLGSYCVAEKNGTDHYKVYCKKMTIRLNLQLRIKDTEMPQIKSLTVIFLLAALNIFVVIGSLTFFLVLMAWRFLVQCLISLRYKNLTLLNGFDALFTYGSTNEETLVLFNMQCKGNPDFQKIQSLINDKAARKHRRLRSFIKPMLCYCAWFEEEHFSIDDHVFWQPEKNIRTQEELGNAIEIIYLTPMHPMKSPWSMYVIPLSKDFENSKGQPLYCILLLYHHALADGYSMSSVITNALTDGEQEVSKFPNPKKKLTSSSPINVKNILKLLISFPSIFAKNYLITKNLFSQHLLSGKKNRFQVRKLNTQKLKHVKDVLGCTVTAVLISCTTAAIQKYAERRNMPLPDRIMVGAGLPFWKEDDFVEPKNNFIAFPVLAPLISNATAKQRLNATRDVFNDSNHQNLLLFTIALTKFVFAILPTFLGKILFTMIPPTYVLSIAGQVVKKEVNICCNGNVIYKSSGVISASNTTGLGILFVFQGDEIDMTLSVDSSLMKKDEIETLTDDIRDELDELFQSTK